MFKAAKLSTCKSRLGTHPCSYQCGNFSYKIHVPVTVIHKCIHTQSKKRHTLLLKKMYCKKWASVKCLHWYLLAENHREAKYRWEDNIKIGFMSPERGTKSYYQNSQWVLKKWGMTVTNQKHKYCQYPTTSSSNKHKENELIITIQVYSKVLKINALNIRWTKNVSCFNLKSSCYYQ